jgi:phenylalanyl-tRNA synthetase beta subunit
MKVSFNWLKEYLSDAGTPQEVADILNMHAFEVEGVEGDIIDVDVLPNRAHDCLCHMGIAKEVVVNTGAKFSVPEMKEAKVDFDTDFKVNIEDPKCRRYVLREIKNIEVKESPKELREKLESIGQKSINNVVDVTNFVMFELNQPMHTFDTSKVDGDTINIRLSNKGENLITLDNNEIELDGETLLIADNGPLAIAGIKGGKKAEVDGNTTSIILESANFAPVNIRKTSNKIGIATDSSKRFENEITPELALKATERATELILKYCSTGSTEVSNLVDEYPRPASPYYTGVSVDEVNKLLGTDLSGKDVSEIFDKLGFEYEYLNTKEFVLEEIRKHLGKPHNTFPSLTYDAPREFDCSTLTAYVFAHGGLSIPRMSVDQLFFGREIEGSELEPGDLIFSNRLNDKNIKYETVEFLPGQKFPEGVDHVGMYMGDGKVIYSSKFNDGVLEEDLSGSKAFPKIVGYRRLVDKDEMRFAVKIPDERLDLRNQNDLIEEIGRVYGYDNIKDEPILELEPDKENTNAEYSAILAIKSKLQGLGFSEVFTSSFASKGDLKVTKPLAENKSYLRTSLEEGVRSALSQGIYNLDLLQQDRVKVYEIGKVFDNGEEKLVMGLGVANKAIKKPKTHELINEALESLGMSDRVKEGDNFVEIDPESRIDLPAGEAGNLESDSGGVEIVFNRDAKYETLSQYPHISRDVAVWIEDGKGGENDIYEIIERHAGDLMKNKRLFDVFSKDGKTSFAVRVVFLSNEKTLTDSEVDEVMDKIYKDLSEKKGFEIR